MSAISLAAWTAQAQPFADPCSGLRLMHWQAGAPEAPVLLLIHGFPSASWDWEAIWQPLAARFRVIAMDMAGFGLSAKPVDHDYRMSAHADAYEALLASLGVHEYHLLAHDYGVTVAQELLARQGRGPRMRSLALLNGGLFPETHRPVLTQRLLNSPLGPLLAAAMGKAALAKNLRRIFGAATPPSDALIDGFWTLIEHGRGRRVMPKLIRYIEERKQHRERWVGALVKTSLPLRVINGVEDPISGAHMLTRLRELRPGTDIVELPSVGHYPQVEAPEAVLRAYLDFRRTP
jgi:pimeloyl-ACP methyl ester carboxylesterase